MHPPAKHAAGSRSLQSCLFGDTPMRPDSNSTTNRRGQRGPWCRERPGRRTAGMGQGPARAAARAVAAHDMPAQEASRAAARRLCVERNNRGDVGVPRDGAMAGLGRPLACDAALYPRDAACAGPVRKFALIGTAMSVRSR
jgi:hypothetical protein